MAGGCNCSDVIYGAELCINGERQGQGKLYVGLASGSWKKRYYNHMQSFRRVAQRNDTELSNYIWDLKLKDVNYEIFWRKVCNAYPYSIEAKRCSLCSREKVEIMKVLRDMPSRALNKKQQILGPCVHRNKHLLGNIDTKQIEQEVRNEIGQEQSIEGSNANVETRQEIASQVPSKRKKYKDRSQRESVGNGKEEQQEQRGDSNDEILIWGSTRSGHLWRQDSQNKINDDNG